MFRLIKTFLLFVAMTYAVGAQDLPAESSLIKMNTRTFDLRSDVRNLRRDDDFIPLTEIAWIVKFVNADRYLNHRIVHIQVRPQPIVDTWPSIVPDDEFPLVDNIPEEFFLDGYQTRSRHPFNRSLLLFPDDDPFDFYVNCYTNNGGYPASCFVTATYPPDPNIQLLARMYHVTAKPYEFREIAHRMREVAYCLDVTDQLKNGTFTPAPFVGLEDELPDLSKCRELIS
ncbi:MAG: hypothetical protein WBN04_10420 [Paracoccaceae bacterium]